jgi:hypothetical protein
MNSFRLCALATIIAAAACSSNNPGNDAGTGDASINDSGKKDSGVKDTGPVDDAGDDGATGPTIDPLCAPADAAATNGSCIKRDDAGVDCNPITNDGCNFADAGEACDFAQNGFKCYNAPPNTAALCASCDVQNGPACLPTETCVPTPTGDKCARYCCDDTDCTPGKCDKTTFQSDPIGFCVK